MDNKFYPKKLHMKRRKEKYVANVDIRNI